MLTSKINLSINTRPSFLAKPQHHPSTSLLVSAFSNIIIPPPNATETGMITRQSLLAKVLNPYERLAMLERKMMKILLNVNKIEKIDFLTFFHFFQGR